MAQPRLRLVSLLLALLFLSLGYRASSVVQGGCDAVYQATTRGGASPASSRSGGFSCSASGWAVERVIDGDTIVLAGGERVRYVSIDAPEVGESLELFGPEATDFNRRLVQGKRVRLERDMSDEDRFGRSLRYVYVGQVLAEAELVREGYAVARAYPPDIKYYPCLLALEQEAQENRRGIWATSGGR